MKIVFLDFDGVLNSYAYLERLRGSGEVDGVMGLDSIAVSRLNRLLVEARAEVVVSSSWRNGRSRAQLVKILGDAGFRGRVVGMTPEWVHKLGTGLLSADERGHEIQAWLDAAPRYGHDVESFVILDDGCDMVHLKDRLVRTSMNDGLLDEHVARAVAVLANPPPLIVLPTIDLSK